MIQTEGLCRSFDGVMALDSLTLRVPPGEVLALLGPNGAGKTTTVRLLNGVLRPDAGSCTVMGLDPVSEGEEVRRRTGVLTENAGLDDRLTARENLLYAARLRGIRTRVASREIDALTERFGISSFAGRPTRGFSTGQRKRVALARAMLGRPDVLFLDEPTSGLDPTATREVVELIATLAREHGRAIVLCTHFLGEAGRLADRMAVLHLGRLVAYGRPAELAAELWPGLEVTLDLGMPATGLVLDVLQAVDGVLAVHPSPAGALMTVRDREVVPRVLSALVARELPVFALTPRPKTLEDVYFAVEREAFGQGPQ